MSPGASRSPALPRPERERRVLDAAEALFYARGVHAVGMDELVRASVEFDDPGHPARAAARDYRAALRKRLRALAERIAPGEGAALAAALIEAARPPGAAAEGAGPADGGRRRG